MLRTEGAALPRFLRLTPLAVTLAGLIGCASTTPADLQSGGKSLAGTTSTTPATSYRQLTQRARECFANAAFQVDADFFPDIQEGRVSLTLRQITRTLATASMRPAAAPSVTAINIHYATNGMANDGWRIVADSMMAWARGEPAACPF